MSEIAYGPNITLGASHYNQVDQVPKVNEQICELKVTVTDINICIFIKQIYTIKFRIIFIFFWKRAPRVELV